MEQLNTSKLIKFGIIGIIGIIVLFKTFYTVKTGTVGVVYQFDEIQGIEQPGLHLKMPFVTKVKPFNIQVLKYETQAGGASKDLQSSVTTVAVNYSVSQDNVEEIVKKVGFDYGTKLLVPAVQESVKGATAKYTAEELITKRELVKEAVRSYLFERLENNLIQVHEVSITNFSFSPSFDKAIEAKVTAEQDALASKNKLEQVKYEAEQKIVTAKAEAESIRIQAQAIQSQGGADYVKLQWIEQWGKGGAQVPNVVADGNSSFLLDINK